MTDGSVTRRGTWRWLARGAVTALGLAALARLAHLSSTDIFVVYAPVGLVTLTVVILIGVFAIQRHGTHRVGRLFGPIMVLWFIVLAVLGVRSMLQHPHVLTAVDPRHALAHCSRLLRVDCSPTISSTSPSRSSTPGPSALAIC